jgi:DnaJ-class molecular chaperone
VDHYQRLQVIRDAGAEVIERAYKALSMKHHPDRAASDNRASATRRMQAINEAYAVLRDPAARARYDRTLPPEDEGDGAWERFMHVGLAGMFADWVHRKG